MDRSQIAMLAAMAADLILIIVVGIRKSEKNETVGDFYLGGRKLGPLVTAMSAEASDMSSWLLMGLPGVAYLSGTANAGWTAVGLAAGTYFNWLITAKRLRRYTEATNSITLPEFFSNRYGDRRKILTLIGAVWIIVFFVPYTASGFAACGKLFHSLFAWDYHASMLLSAVVIVFYTTMGGFLAASTTDFIQSVVMTAALAIVLVFGTLQAGGVDAVIENAKAMPGYLSFTQSHDPLTGSAVPVSALAILSTLAWGLGYFGMPHILLRFMAIEDDRKLVLSRRVASVWVVVSMATAVFIGVMGSALSAKGLVPLLAGADSETIIVRIARLLSTHGIPAALVAGVILAGILASTMSTSDSQLLAASSSVSNDIAADVFHLNLGKKKLLAVSRMILVGIAAVGIVLAWDPKSSVFQIVSFAWGGFGASFGPVILLSLFWRRSNKYGAVAGMLTGGIMIFVWKFLIRPLGGLWDIYELLPAFLAALGVNAAVSLATGEPEREVLDTFDRVRGSMR